MELNEITPKHSLCVAGTCPAIFETDRGTVLIIGRRLRDEEVQQHLSQRVGDGEWVVEVPKPLLDLDR